MASSVIIHILHNYDNILVALEDQLSKAESTMDLIVQSGEDIPKDILMFYARVSDARAALKDSYKSLYNIKEIN